MPATLDARTLRDAMSRYLQALQRHREEMDSLNVFPVPDGDTGTNMVMTQQAVEDALRDLDGAGLPEVAEAISRAALMGARGNSGVILSQVLRGMCARLRSEQEPGAEDLAAALAEAAGEARRAVADPVEGTMLTVLRDAADGARVALADGRACDEVAAAALMAATDSLERTKELLPALAAAGVVDAGGKGVVLLFDALTAALRGGDMTVDVGPLGPVGTRSDASTATDAGQGYEVMYLLECRDGAIASLRERLGGIGDSLVVVGGGGLFNVHVHTDDPGRAVEEGVQAGRPSGIRITNLTDQVEACLAGEARGVRVAAELADLATIPVVAVAQGDGFVELFRSLGASTVEGGPGKNPSVGDLVRAIEYAPGEPVWVLPNHENVLPAAGAAARESTKEVEVLATSSMPQGLSVAAAFTPDRDASENRKAMRERLGTVSAAIARAEREAGTDAGAVRVGDWVGLIHEPGKRERVAAVGRDPGEVAASILSSATALAFELASLYLGAEADPEEAAEVERALRDHPPGLEVEVQQGGQPLYPYLIGLE